MNENFFVIKTNDLFIISQNPEDGEIFYGPVTSRDEAFQAQLELRNGRNPISTTKPKGGTRLRRLIVE